VPEDARSMNNIYLDNSQNDWGWVGPLRDFPSEAVFSYFTISKILQDFSSHQIFGHMHEALNIDKK
jgi:hypothetical protein